MYNWGHNMNLDTEYLAKTNCTMFRIVVGSFKFNFLGTTPLIKASYGSYSNLAVKLLFLNLVANRQFSKNFFEKFV